MRISVWWLIPVALACPICMAVTNYIHHHSIIPT